MKSSREVKEAATLAERERIIKLLEDEMLSDDDTAWQTRDWAEVERQQDQDWVIKEAIALIKGQTDCVCRPEGQCLYHKALAKVEGETK